MICCTNNPDAHIRTFLSARVLFDGGFSLSVSLRILINIFCITGDRHLVMFEKKKKEKFT